MNSSLKHRFATTNGSVVNAGTLASILEKLTEEEQRVLEGVFRNTEVDATRKASARSGAPHKWGGP